jgi:hypothetical protein
MSYALVFSLVRRVLPVLVLTLAALAPLPALASGWSAIASTCAPSDNAVLTPARKVAVKYAFVGGMFQYQPLALSDLNWRGAPLPITVRCMVLNPYEVTSPAWGRLIVSYQDPDGEATASRVVVKLSRLFRPSGAQTIATFDSNTLPATGAAVVDHAILFDPAHMDFATSDYVVGIHLYRSTRESNPRVLRVRLDE